MFWGMIWGRFLEVSLGPSQKLSEHERQQLIERLRKNLAGLKRIPQKHRETEAADEREEAVEMLLAELEASRVTFK